MKPLLRARLYRLDFFLDLWPWLDDEWRERLTEEVRAVVRLLLTDDDLQAAPDAITLNRAPLGQGRRDQGQGTQTSDEVADLHAT